MTDQPTAEPGAEATPSIEETLSAAFDSAQESDSTEGAEATPNTSETEGTEEVAAAAETDTESEEGEETPDQGNEQTAETEKPLDAPASWSADEKAKFAALPREAQEIVARRESEREIFLNQKSQELASVRREYDALDAAIGKERKEAWALSGWQSPAHAIGFLVAQSDLATRDPAGFIRSIAERTGIDLAELANGAPAPDPQLSALKQRLDHFEQSEAQRQRQAVEQNQMAVKTAVEQFAADTKSHPYFKDVEADLAAILPGIVQQNPGKSQSELLKIAYDKAVWANETTRAKLQAETRKSEELAAAQAAKKAKTLASTNVKSSGNVPDGRRKLTMDETLAAAFDQAQQRA